MLDLLGLGLGLLGSLFGGGGNQVEYKTKMYDPSDVSGQLSSILTPSLEGDVKGLYDQAGTLSNTLGDTARMLEYAPSGAEAEQGKETKRRLKYTENDLRAMLTSYLKKVEGDVYLQNKQAETQMVMANAQNKAVANMGLQDMLYRLIPNLISGGGSGAGNFPGRNVSPASYLGTLGLRR